MRPEMTVDEAVADALRFYESRLTAFAHSSYELQANAPSADAIRAAWARQDSRSPLERLQAELLDPLIDRAMAILERHNAIAPSSSKPDIVDHGPAS